MLPAKGAMHENKVTRATNTCDRELSCLRQTLDVFVGDNFEQGAQHGTDEV